MKLRIDSASASHIAMCQCGWRALRPNLAAAWYAAARHALHTHTDRRQYDRAMSNAAKAGHRANRRAALVP